MNKIILMGRLTKEPEMRYTATSKAVCSFTIAVNRKMKQEGQPDSDFFQIVTWNKTAEFCNNYFKKGQQVAITGRLQNRSWDDADGKKRYATEVIADEVFFADSKKADSNQTSNNTNVIDELINSSVDGLTF